MAHFAPSKAKRPTFSWSPLPAMKINTTTTMAINTQIATSCPPASTSCKSCEKWGAPCPFCIHQAPPPSPLESKWLDDDCDSERGREREGGKMEEHQKKEEERQKQKMQNKCQMTNTLPVPSTIPLAKKTSYPFVIQR